MTRTVFITNYHPFVTKNILNSGVLDALAQRARVVILVPKDKEAHFKPLYEKDGVVVAGVNVQAAVESRKNRFFARMAEWLLNTNVMKFHKLEAFEKTHRVVKYYISIVFTPVFAHVTPFKKFVRLLDTRLNRARQLDVYFETYRPDVVFATDAFNDADLFWLKEAKARGVKTVAMLRSWDNTTARSFLRFVPDRLIVHNEVMKRDMLTYHNVQEEIIVLSGIPQFEKYLSLTPTPKEEFYRSLGADPTKRLVLVAPAGHFFIDTDWQMCQILKDLYHEKKIPQDIQFLIRLHPFLPVDLSRFQVDEQFLIDVPGPAKANDLGKGKKEGELEADTFFQHLHDSLHYASLVINSMSSIIIDTSIFDKPLITINFDGWEKESDVPFLRSLPRRWRKEENQISWMSFGMTPLVKNKDELATWINTYLADPTVHAAQRKVFKDAYCWKFDGKAAERIASYVVELL